MAREKQLGTREHPLDYQLIFQQKLYGLDGSGMIYSKCWREKSYNQEYSGKIITQNLRGNKEFPRQAKAKGIHQHQTGLTGNV